MKHQEAGACAQAAGPTPCTEGGLLYLRMVAEASRQHKEAIGAGGVAGRWLLMWQKNPKTICELVHLEGGCHDSSWVIKNHEPQ